LPGRCAECKTARAQWRAPAPTSALSWGKFKVRRNAPVAEVDDNYLIYK
jgi:hypothetical protein